MKPTALTVALLVLLALGAGASRAQEPVATDDQPLAAPEAALGTGFTYQGRLTYNGAPVNDSCSFIFSLWDAATGGTRITGENAMTGVPVSGGLFTVQLDFGTAPFTGEARWLQIIVVCHGVEGTLSPRQPLRPAPYALALPGLRTEQNTTSPNIIAGSSANRVATGVYGANIAGGSSDWPNNVYDLYGVIGGGENNKAGSDDGNRYTGFYATVAGGFYNTASGREATVGGGAHNTSADYGTVGGGDGNRATGEAAAVGGGLLNGAYGDCATVGGGRDNDASGTAATVPGGSGNSAAGAYSFAAGRGAGADDDGTFVWADSTGSGFTDTGPNQFLIRAAGGVGMGTNWPKAQLHVAKGISGSASRINHVAVIENTSTESSPDVLLLAVGNIDPTEASNFITFQDGEGNLGSIEGNGSGGIALNTTGGDLAEYLPRQPGAVVAPGDVVGLHPQGLSRQTTGALRVLAVTTAPAVLGNEPPEGQQQGFAPVALLGQVPVRVRGAVEAGDLILPSGRADGAGVAVRPAELRADQAGLILGTALETSHDADLKPVTMLVGLPTDQALLSLIRQQAEQLADQEARLAALERAAGAGAAGTAALPGGWLLAGGGLVAAAGLVIQRRRMERLS